VPLLTGGTTPLIGCAVATLGAGAAAGEGTGAAGVVVADIEPANDLDGATGSTFVRPPHETMKRDEQHTSAKPRRYDDEAQGFDGLTTIMAILGYRGFWGYAALVDETPGAATRSHVTC
jgi:hypothetical protein